MRDDHDAFPDAGIGSKKNKESTPASSICPTYTLICGKMTMMPICWQQLRRLGQVGTKKLKF